MDFSTTIEMSEKWGISSRRITTLCNQGRVKGAILKGNTWLIPSENEKPDEKKRGPQKK